MMDIVSPYGYGGPYAVGATDLDVSEFWRGIEAWALREDVVCAFARLSLFERAERVFSGVVEPRFRNVVWQISDAPEQRWRRYAPKVRKNVQKAIRSGVTIAQDEGERLGAFVELYQHTMERRDADQRYRFSMSFFQAIIDTLPGRFRFFHAFVGDRIISTELVLLSATRMYSFLGGTYQDAFALRPNDLLKHVVAEWGAAQGFDTFVLGGGQGADDGILQYKLGFSPSGAIDFKVGARVFSRDAYEALVNDRAVWESRRGERWRAPMGVFPAYRY